MSQLVRKLGSGRRSSHDTVALAQRGLSAALHHDPVQDKVIPDDELFNEQLPFDFHSKRTVFSFKSENAEKWWCIPFTAILAEPCALSSDILSFFFLTYS